MALADAGARIVRVRLDELHGFMPRARDPQQVRALHDMRIAAKRLRYALEVVGPCFGAYAGTAVDHVKELQDLLGEIHDCDVMLPRVLDHLEQLRTQDAGELRRAAGGAADLAPELAGRAPGRTAYRGLVTLAVWLQARRELLFARFDERWSELERKGFRARLQYALDERPGADTMAAADDA